MSRSSISGLHGATKDEVEFLLGRNSRRVELNAITSRQFINFIEAKLAERGVEKVIPEHDVIEQHARRLVAQNLERRALAEARGRIAKEAADTTLPDDLDQRLRDHLDEAPALPWDEALAIILGDAA